MLLPSVVETRDNQGNCRQNTSLPGSKNFQPQSPEIKEILKIPVLNIIEIRKIESDNFWKNEEGMDRFGSGRRCESLSRILECKS